MCSPPSNGPSAFCRPPSDRVVLTATLPGVDDAMIDVAAADGVAGLHTGAARLAEMLARLWAEDPGPDDPERRGDAKEEARTAVAVRPWSVTSVQPVHVAAAAGAGPNSTTGGAAHADVAGTPCQPDPGPPGPPRLFVIRTRVRLAWTRRGVPSELQWSQRLWTLPVRQYRLYQQSLLASTLGGAHSQLGDIHSDHAIKARQMAFVQQRIAIAMGNAGLAARCSLFVVWSDLQRGRYAEASKAIKAHRAVCLASSDPALRDLWQAAAGRLKKLRREVKDRRRMLES